MNIGTIIIKILVIFAMVLLIAIPFVINYIVFRWDKMKKISHLRWRNFICTTAYIAVATLFLLITDGLFKWTAEKYINSWMTEAFAKIAENVYSARVWFVLFANLALGVIFVLFSVFFRAGITKKNLLEPLGAEGKFTFLQKAERFVLKKLNTETWFLAGRIVYYLAIFLSVVYELKVVLSLIPAQFTVDFTTYENLHMIFESGNIYPALTLLGLWESYYFVEGVKRINEECPGFSGEEKTEIEAKAEFDIEALDKKVAELFGTYFRCDAEVSDNVLKELSGKQGFFAQLIGKAASEDERNPGEYNELYLNCIDKIAKSDKSIIINGNFFSPFSGYFLRYLSVVAARGDNLVLVCNTDGQIDAVYDYITKGLALISSPYCSDFEGESVNFDDPIWKIAKTGNGESGSWEASLEEKNILVTSLEYLCSTRFEEENSGFIPSISNIIFVDAVYNLSNYSGKLAVLNTRLRHINEKTAASVKSGSPEEQYKARYEKRQVRYICFDSMRTEGLSDVLENLLAVDFEIADAMSYSENTKVRCYSYKPLETSENSVTPQFFKSCDSVSAAVNMAVYCLSEGAEKVTIFADENIPYRDIEGTIAANAGQVSVSADVNSITINAVEYSQGEKSVVIILDSGMNLPATIRKYASMMSKEPALLLIFSKPYLMYDYYLSNISSLWQSHQIEKIPVESGTIKGTVQKILVKANSGGILTDELLCYASDVPQFAEYVNKGDINGILKEILLFSGKTIKSNTDVFKYFEYTASREFDKAGKYKQTDKVILKRNENLFEFVNGSDKAVLVTPGGEATLPVPRNRISQKFIAGQNFVYDGRLYVIKNIDFATGKIYGQLAVAGNEAYSYLQVREYRMETAEEQVEYVLPSKHIVFNVGNEDVAVNDVFVSVVRAPMDVITKRYYDIDPDIMVIDMKKPEYHDISSEGNDRLSKETYRKYGQMKDPGYSPDSIRKAATVSYGEKGALTLCIRVRGSFGPDINKTKALAVAMLNEIIHSVFPSVADSVVVCSTINEDSFDEKSALIMEKQPAITLLGENEIFGNKEDFNILIIEDCAGELGVISELMSDGENILKLLFSDVFDYLEWYLNSEEKSDYLNFGEENAPDCFDFVSLHKLSKIFGGKTKSFPRIEEMPLPEEKLTCSFCSKRGVKDEEVVVLEDGRKICRECAKALVGNDEEALKQHLKGVRLYMESTYGINFGEDFSFCFESAAKIKNMLISSGKFGEQNSDIPGDAYADGNSTIYVEHSLPSANLSELIARELTYMWQRKNLKGDVPTELTEGHAALVIVQYLRFINNKSLADARNAFYESTSSTSGIGYRQMTQGLLNHPQFGNNPFRYMESISGIRDEKETPPLKKVKPEDKSEPYVPEAPDRAGDEGITYYYYSNITERKRKLYDIIFSGITEHKETAMAEGYSFGEICEVFEYIRCDRPELFYIRTLSVCGDEITFEYGADAKETAELKARIEKVVESYLSEIRDDMSAYDVALHFHVKLINSLDYDTVFLEQETDEDTGVDYIRTICGPFLNKKAVCTGYAHAFQYLMQKCGIECTKVSGVATNSAGSSERHAWNLVKIDNEYYYTDTTWDDSSDTVQEVKNTHIGFSYFCVTTEEILRSRKIKELPHMPPVCTAKKANYYTHNGLVIDSCDEEKLLGFVDKAVKNGNESVTFKCSSKAVFDKTVSALFGTEQLCFSLLIRAAEIRPSVKMNSCTHSQDKNLYTITIFFENN